MTRLPDALASRLFAAALLLGAPTASLACPLLSFDTAEAYSAAGLQAYQAAIEEALAAEPDNDTVEFSAQNVELLSRVPLDAFPGLPQAANDVWGYVSPASREYAFIGLERGTGFVEVTDPLNPIIVGVIPGPRSTWRDMEFYGNYAYSVNEDCWVGGGRDEEGEQGEEGEEGARHPDHPGGCSSEVASGMQVIDVSQIDQGVVTLVNEHYTELNIHTAHNVRVNQASGFLYLCGPDAFAGGLVVLDLNADPVAPPLAGVWGGLYVHDVIVVNYTEGPWAGREVAFASCGPHGLFIVDFTDKAAPAVLGAVRYPTRRYCHHGWLDPQKRYFYINDELDEMDGTVSTTTTYVADVTDLAHPQLVGQFTNGLQSIDHNPMGRGNLLFEANYSSGLRVYDISDPLNVSEAGFFDTRPEDNGTSFLGAWGVHVMLPSRVVLVSDRQRGLFLLDVSALEPSLSAGALIR